MMKIAAIVLLISAGFASANQRRVSFENAPTGQRQTRPRVQPQRQDSSSGAQHPAVSPRGSSASQVSSVKSPAPAPIQTHPSVSLSGKEPVLPNRPSSSARCQSSSSVSTRCPASVPSSSCSSSIKPPQPAPFSSSCSSSTSSTSCSTSLISSCSSTFLPTCDSSSSDEEPLLSRCTRCLEEMIIQPPSCGEEYLTPAASQVYNPCYYWFDLDPSALLTNMAAFSRDVGVGVLVADEMGQFIGLYDPYNNLYTATNTAQGAAFWLNRSWSLNEPTFNQAYLNSSIYAGYSTQQFQVGMISQTLINSYGQVRVVSVFAPWCAMPLVC